MIELAFVDSAAGGLKMAKSITYGQRVSGAVGVIGGTKKELRKAKKPRNWTGVIMAGGPQDVEALTLALDIGDISTGMDARRKVLDDLFGDFPGVPDAIWKTNQHALARIEETRESREHIRIWISESNPAELCGLYFICHILADAQTPLSAVYIPSRVERDSSMIWYRNTGEIPAEEFGAFAEYESPISGLQRGAYAAIWGDLARENAPLRAIVNGRITGVPDYFYDFALRANMPEGECRVAQLIGKTLNQIPGVGDRWLFLRIQKMIRSGELAEVSAATDDHPYSAVLRRGDL
jgi:hypothetical protein